MAGKKEEKSQVALWKSVFVTRITTKGLELLMYQELPQTNICVIVQFKWSKRYDKGIKTKYIKRQQMRCASSLKIKEILRKTR